MQAVRFLTKKSNSTYDIVYDYALLFCCFLQLFITASYVTVVFGQSISYALIIKNHVVSEILVPHFICYTLLKIKVI